MGCVHTPVRSEPEFELGWFAGLSPRLFSGILFDLFSRLPRNHNEAQQAERVQVHDSLGIKA